MENYFYAQIIEARNKLESKIREQPSKHFNLPESQIIPQATLE